MFSEKDFLNEISARAGHSVGVNELMVEYTFDIFNRFYRSGESVLELGPAEGVMTRRLKKVCVDLEVVEGSSIFCEKLKAEFPSIRVTNDLFEDFHSERKFDWIVLSHVLEHVADPVGLVVRLSDFLEPGGRVFAAVPNAQSVHRQAAVLMGLLPRENSLNDSDCRHGHRRVYDSVSFKELFESAKYSIDHFGGYWLKPLSNAQLEASWSSDMIMAFMSLGERYADIAAENYIVARPIR